MLIRKFVPTILGLVLAAATSLAVMADDHAAPGPKDPLDLARSMIESEQYEKALAALKLVEIEDDTTVAQIDVLVGRIFLAIGKPAKALDHFEHAGLSSLDAEADADLGMAEAHLALGDLAKAKKTALDALKSDPDLVAAHLVLARVDQRLGRAADALARLRRLQTNQPDSDDVAVVLARYLAIQNGPAAGVTELQAFVDRNPSSAVALDTLGQLLWAAGRKSDAVTARTAAQQFYAEGGQDGRAAAMAAWLKAVDPQDKLAPREAKEEDPAREEPDEDEPEGDDPGKGAVPPEKRAPAGEPSAKPAEEGHEPDPVLKPPPATAKIGPKEPPKPQASQRAPVEAAPLPPPTQKKIAQAVALDHPEPLPFEPGTMMMTGSGIVLEGGRQIITNRHVVEGMRTVAVRNGTGHVRKARIVKMSNDDDLALLEIDSPFPEAAAMPLSSILDPATGRAAIVMGYPLINLLGDEQPALTEGIISKANGLGNDPDTFQMTAKINKGNSGGPVFDKRGHLLGVAVGKTDTAKIYQKSGVMVEDVNLGIKGGRILAFLGKKPVQETAPPEMSLEDLYQQMLPSAVLIAAQK